MQSTLNLKVKFRESFRPFAPAVLQEDAADWFELDAESPYMLLVAPLAAKQRIAPAAADEALEGIARLKVARSTIPAVTHVDDSARIQTVDRQTNPELHRLLTEFKAQTGCPVVVNTSFNVRGEPPVLTPEDAFRCFMGTDIDVLVFGNCHLRKEAQDPAARPRLSPRLRAGLTSSVMLELLRGFAVNMAELLLIFRASRSSSAGARPSATSRSRRRRSTSSISSSTSSSTCCCCRG